LIRIHLLIFREQDEFALRSHTLAEKATKEGKLLDLVPYFVPRGKGQKTISTDNTVRVSTIEKLSALKPAFIKPHGTITPGN
jgi:acetyl-CoA acyltransferase